MMRMRRKEPDDVLLTQATGAALALQRASETAEKHLRRLEDRHGSRAALISANTVRLDPAGGALALLRRCRVLRHGDPTVYLSWARAAYQTAGGLEPTEELAILAAAEWGNALRVAGRATDAERVLMRGRKQTRGADSIIAAEIQCMAASLDLELRRLHDAVRHADRAAELFHLHELPRDRARAVLKRTLAQVELEEFDAALSGATDVLEILRGLSPEPAADIPAAAGAVYTLVMAAGASESAATRRHYMELALEARIRIDDELHIERRGTETQRLHWRWIRSRQTVLAGFESIAEGMLQRLIEDFLAAGLPTRSATAALDLMLLRLRAGDFRTAYDHAVAAYDLLTGAGLECQAVAALRVLVEMERWDEGVVLAQMRSLRSIGWRRLTE